MLDSAQERTGASATPAEMVCPEVQSSRRDRSRQILPTKVPEVAEVDKGLNLNQAPRSLEGFLFRGFWCPSLKEEGR